MEDNETVVMSYSKDELAGIILDYIARRDGLDMETENLTVAYTCGRVRVKEKYVEPTGNIQFFIKRKIESPSSETGYEEKVTPLDPSEVEDSIRTFLGAHNYEVQKIDFRVTGEQATNFEGVSITSVPQLEKTI